MALPAESGVIMHVSPCQPRSAIFATATVMPALIFSALKPGGREGSEKSTVSGFWPTNSIRIMLFLHASGGGRIGATCHSRSATWNQPTSDPHITDDLHSIGTLGS